MVELFDSFNFLSNYDLMGKWKEVRQKWLQNVLNNSRMREDQKWEIKWEGKELKGEYEQRKEVGCRDNQMSWLPCHLLLILFHVSYAMDVLYKFKAVERRVGYFCLIEK